MGKKSELYYKNRIHLLIQRDPVKNAKIINKLKRTYRNLYGKEIED